MELTNDFEVAVAVEEAWTVLTDLERIAPCMPGAELKEVEGDEYRGVVKVKVGPITASYRGAARFEELDAEHHRAVLKADGRETRGQGNASATITATLSPGDGGTRVHVATEIAITGKVAQFGRGVLADVSGKLLDQFVQNLETMVLAPGSGAAAVDPAPGADGAVETPTGAPTETATAGSSGTTSPADIEAGAAADGLTDAAAGGATGAAAREAAGGTSPDAAAAPESSTQPASVSIRQIDSVPAEPVELLSVAGSSVAKRMVPFASVAGLLVLIRIVIYAMKRRKH